MTEAELARELYWEIRRFKEGALPLEKLLLAVYWFGYMGGLHDH